MRNRFRNLTPILFSLLPVFVLAQNSAQFQPTPFHRITLNKNDTIYQFIVSKGSKEKLATERMYFWYASDSILQTRGGFDGQVLNGSYKVFYPNKNLKQLGQFEGGLKVGLWKIWYPNGELQMVCSWDKGMKSGDFIEYEMDGFRIMSGTYRNDLLDGKIISYSREGERQTTHYKNGRIIVKKSKNSSEDSMPEDNQ